MPVITHLETIDFTTPEGGGADPNTLPHLVVFGRELGPGGGCGV